MTKATVRLGVAGVDFVFRVIFSTIVVGQLDEAFSVKDAVAVGQGLRGVVAEEIEIELGIGKFQLFNNGHPQEFVELD